MDDHGLAGTRIYYTWKKMHARCYNPEDPNFYRYGARGIQVCRRWNSVFNFLEDMGHPPQGMSIDRIDNDGDYTPENCHWATQEQQNENTSRNRYVTFDGREQTIKAWAKEFDLNPRCLSERLRRGWDVERAMTTPTARNYAEGRTLHNDKTKAQWAKKGAQYRANAASKT